MILTIYSKADVELCKTAEFKYSGSFMGERSVSMTINSPTPISFMPFDYIDIRGERFVIDYIPTNKKISSALSIGNAFSYDVNFVSHRSELEKCTFKDVVLGDSYLHYTGMPKVDFTGDVYMLADRILANLNQLYASPSNWTITVDSSVVRKVENVSISDGNCLSALALVNSLFKLNFTPIGRSITIGVAGITHASTFEYGKGKGLYSIDRNSVTDAAVVTRLRCYGSDKNIPSGYKKGSGSTLPAAQYIPSLMLPNYETTLIDYIDSSVENKGIYGIREGILRDETIFPSLEGMTAEQIVAAGGTSASTGRIDVITSATAITTTDQTDFKIIIPDIGFNINDHLGTDTATIDITDGRLGGVSFPITTVKAITGGFELTVNRNNDSNFPLPDAVTNCSSGDHFVIAGIQMPDIYVKAAEQRLLTAGQAYLAKYDHAQSTYSVGIDEIFMTTDASSSVVREGDSFHVLDADLGIDAPIMIQQLTITYGEIIPKYEVTLSDTPIATTLERVKDSITQVAIASENSILANEILARRNVQGLNRLRNYAFDPVTGKLNPTVIAAGSITAEYLSIGFKTTNFVLLANIIPNYNG